MDVVGLIVFGLLGMLWPVDAVDRIRFWIRAKKIEWSDQMTAKDVLAHTFVAMVVLLLIFAALTIAAGGWAWISIALWMAAYIKIGLWWISSGEAWESSE